jgi:ABC-type dipeptide/oligopeptide/nickel transport system permease subunit
MWRIMIAPLPRPMSRAAATLLALALAVNLLGDWLRDALNPRLR